MKRSYRSQRSGFITKRILAFLSTTAAILSAGTFLWTQTSLIHVWTDQLGLTASPVDIAGTGSMAPTFAIGEGKTPEERAQETVATLEMWRYPGGVNFSQFSTGQYQLQYGDLVFVRDSRLGNVVGTNGLIKRVIGLPGDSIELRDGFVWRNGERVVEPYTLQPRSTFGGTSITECTVTTVPSDSIFILGDNRKQSDDSRFRLGFVPLSSVQRYYPLTKQVGSLDSKWRADAEKDAELAGQLTFESAQFITALNALRAQKKLKPLTTNGALTRYAQARADAWLSATPPATSAASILNGAKQHGYQNPLLAELPVSGFYSSQELVDAVEEVSPWSDILLRADYQEIGIGVRVQNKADECTKQSIVIFLGGYVPAQYDAEMVKSWETALARLAEVRPGWLELEKSQQGLNDEQKKDLTELLGILDTRLQRIESLVQTMQRREWFSDEQEKWLEEDPSLAERQFSLSNQLNSR
jgi:signal peptidase I